MSISDITQNIKTTLASTLLYNGTETKGFATVELLRLVNVINNRYPFIVVLGPQIEPMTETYRTSNVDLEYQIVYMPLGNDESEIVNTELSYLTRNVNADIIKSLMVDPTRGGYATNTIIEEASYDFDIVSGDAFNKISSDIEIFYRSVILNVSGVFDADDIALIG